MSRHIVLFRVSCAMLLMVGLGLSLLEGTQCREAQGSVVVQVTSHANVGATDIPSEAPAPGGGHCCPCIHTYPNAITAAVGAAPTLVGYSTTYAALRYAPLDRHPQPLVPPPIA